ncbi:hypothetical protein [Streptomyces ficellus]|uniref:Uncharacterized protein n=1 Tax=Streptomyces ficellus TaxID=1977088 RepID=A0A6I6FBT5_9ACTN|nr:hypothetical protein [Streptomyces ficellus]QGV81180.1 hypothetical protein EIZ62_25255 [Streptomyces ficellus]
MRTTGSMTAVRWLDAQLVVPRADRGERIVCYAGALAGTVFAVALALHAGYAALPLIVVAVVAFDLFGGTVVNATRSAKRRFHRPGRTARHHLTFVAVHVQPFVLALLVPGFGWAAAGVVYGVVLGGAAVVLAAPANLRRPVAFAASAMAITVTSTGADLPRELAWFAPVLVIKLLLAHLLPEEENVSG